MNWIAITFCSDPTKTILNLENLDIVWEYIYDSIKKEY
jgi:hypothetical protein